MRSRRRRLRAFPCCDRHRPSCRTARPGPGTPAGPIARVRSPWLRPPAATAWRAALRHPRMCGKRRPGRNTGTDRRRDCPSAQRPGRPAGPTRTGRPLPAEPASWSVRRWPSPSRPGSAGPAPARSPPAARESASRLPVAAARPCRARAEGAWPGSCRTTARSDPSRGFFALRLRPVRPSGLRPCSETVPAPWSHTPQQRARRPGRVPRR